MCVHVKERKENEYSRESQVFVCHIRMNINFMWVCNVSVNLCAFMEICMYTCMYMHFCVCACMHLQMNMYIHTYIHTHTHSYTHKHTHKHTHMHARTNTHRHNKMQPVIQIDHLLSHDTIMINTNTSMHASKHRRAFKPTVPEELLSHDIVITNLHAQIQAVKNQIRNKKQAHESNMAEERRRHAALADRLVKSTKQNVFFRQAVIGGRLEGGVPDKQVCVCVCVCVYM